jgi:hypothetical protein
MSLFNNGDFVTSSGNTNGSCESAKTSAYHDDVKLKASHFTQGSCFKSKGPP